MFAERIRTDVSYKKWQVSFKNQSQILKCQQYCIAFILLFPVIWSYRSYYQT